MVFVNTCLECASNFSIGASSWGFGSGVFVEWMFFWIFFLCHFAVDMYGGRCFISSTFMLVHVEKWTFLMACGRVLRTGLKIVTWYHCDKYVLVLSARLLSAAVLGGIGGWPLLLFRLTFHTPGVVDRVLSNTARPCFAILR